jgi:hypothetical protein
VSDKASAVATALRLGNHHLTHLRTSGVWRMVNAPTAVDNDVVAIAVDP